MKAPLTGIAVAALLVAGALPGFAQDAAKPQPPAPAAEPAPPPAANETVPRPSLVPKAAEPAAPAADNEPAPAPRRRHYAHRYHRYGYYRTAYWEPFPIYWPHLRHNRIYWNRIPWFVRF
jgi:hypothetical protein